MLTSLDSAGYTLNHYSNNNLQGIHIGENGEVRKWMNALSECFEKYCFAECFIMQDMN